MPFSGRRPLHKDLGGWCLVLTASHQVTHQTLIVPPCCFQVNSCNSHGFSIQLKSGREDEQRSCARQQEKSGPQQSLHGVEFFILGARSARTLKRFWVVDARGSEGQYHGQGCSLRVVKFSNRQPQFNILIHGACALVATWKSLRLSRWTEVGLAVSGCF